MAGGRRDDGGPGFVCRGPPSVSPLASAVDRAVRGSRAHLLSLPGLSMFKHHVRASICGQPSVALDSAAASRSRRSVPSWRRRGSGSRSSTSRCAASPTATASSMRVRPAVGQRDDEAAAVGGVGRAGSPARPVRRRSSRPVMPPEVSISDAVSAFGDSWNGSPERRSVASTSNSPRLMPSALVDPLLPVADDAGQPVDAAEHRHRVGLQVRPLAPPTARRSGRRRLATLHHPRILATK